MVMRSSQQGSLSMIAPSEHTVPKELRSDIRSRLVPQTVQPSRHLEHLQPVSMSLAEQRENSSMLGRVMPALRGCGTRSAWLEVLERLASK